MNQGRYILLGLICLCQSITAQTFIENKGQWPDQVAFRAELDGAIVYVEEDGLLIDIADPEHINGCAHDHQCEDLPETLAKHAYKVRFLNTEKRPSIEARSPIPGTHNYFLGNDSSKWASNARAYKAVMLKEVLPGVAADYYFQSNGLLKYDLHLEPGVSPYSIQIEYEGVQPEITETGELLIPTSVNTLIEAKPYAYQEMSTGVRVLVDCEYTLNGHVLGFKLGEYDRSLPLVIDPELRFSTFTGSTANNFGYTASFDQAGFLYSGSSVFSQGYPVDFGAYDATFNGGTVDIAISKFDTTGTFFIWNTYLGGSANELAHSIIVNEQDELFVFGTSGSDDFPVTSTAYDQSFDGGFGFNPDGIGAGFATGSDIIVAKLSFDGSELLGSTYVGSNGNDGFNLSPATNYNYADQIRGEIELDADGNVLVISSTNNNGNPNNFPTTPGVIQPSVAGGVQDAVIFKMDDQLTDLIWSTLFGGNASDAGLSITYNEEGDIIVCGGTDSDDLPTTSNALQQSFEGGDADPWVMVMNEDASQILHCSYWGTEAYDQAYMVELDTQGNVHLFGQTESGNDYIINADYSIENSGQFITKMNPELSSVIWSTTFGNGNGLPNISPTAFLVDLCDRIYLSGWGGPTGGGSQLTTNGLPISPDAYQNTTDGGDFYLMAISDDASELVYGSFFGGDESNEHVDGGTSRFDRKGRVYQAVCAGCQNNDDFPIFPANAISSINGSQGCNLGVFKMDFELPAVIADFIYTPICLPDTAHFTNTSLGGISYDWDFGDGTNSDDFAPSHVYEAPGLYTVTLIINDPLSCNLADTLMRDIFIFDPQGAELSDTTVCEGGSIQIGFEELALPGLSYSWNNGGLLNNPNISDPVATITETTLFELTIDNGLCPSTATQTIFVQSIALEASADTIICDGEEVTLTATTFGTATDYIWSTEPDFEPVLSTDSTITVSPSFATTYYIQASDECATETSVNVGLFSDAFAMGSGQYICAGDKATVALTNVGDTEGLDISWSPEGLIQSGQGSQEISLITDVDVWMHVDVMDEAGCLWEDSALVEISPLSFIDVIATAQPTLIPLGGDAQLSGLPDGYSYTWTPPNGLNNSGIQNPTSSPSQSTTYVLTVTDGQLNGDCLRSDSVTVNVFEFDCFFPTTFIPNAFSPNKDGVNDVLYVRSDYIERFDLKIYDRWGEIIFQTQDQTVGWDGTYRGQELAPDVYVYHLDIVCIDGQENFEKGNITLIR